MAMWLLTSKGVELVPLIESVVSECEGWEEPWNIEMEFVKSKGILLMRRAVMTTEKSQAGQEEMMAARGFSVVKGRR